MAIGVLGIILMVVILQTSALEQMKKQLDEVTARLNSGRATRSGATKSSSSSTDSTDGASVGK
ncbi:MAG: hypothetical protein K2W95_02575 [Candidatus Obscuribacterales bacterium]|nr:hypothetical protein [Candidatus Obscuribacterales bacterium]